MSVQKASPLVAALVVAAGCLGATPAVTLTGSFHAEDSELVVDIQVSGPHSGLTIHLVAADGTHVCSLPVEAGRDAGGQTTENDGPTNLTIPAPTRPAYVFVTSASLRASNDSVEYLAWSEADRRFVTRRAHDVASLPVAFDPSGGACREGGVQCTSTTANPSLCRLALLVA